MHFSSGDWVAVAVGTVGIGKWILDIVVHYTDRAGDQTSTDQGKFTQLLSDFSAHKAEDRTEFKWIKEALGEVKESIEKVERKVDTVQSQIRFVAAGANNKPMQMGE